MFRDRVYRLTLAGRNARYTRPHDYRSFRSVGDSHTADTGRLMKLAFLGLGVMGYPMAGHLTTAGHSVTVYNRTREKAERWCHEFGGAHAETPAAAAGGAEIVFACVGNDQDIDAVALSVDGAIAAMSPGSIFVDHTTTSADQARKMATAAQQAGVGFVDAPVSGGQSGAEAGRLTAMCGGEAAWASNSRLALVTVGLRLRCRGAPPRPWLFIVSAPLSPA